MTAILETLHPDLIPYICRRWVDHPLVRAELGDGRDVSRINRFYAEKRASLEKARAEGDWGKYIYLHERPHRLRALRAASSMGLERNPGDYWKLVGEAWEYSENIYQDAREWRRLWTREIEGRRACMSDEDLAVFDALPEQVTAWRGLRSKRGILGLSWTLDEKKAIWTAMRFAGVPHLAKGTVMKRDVLAYFGGRKEREIVARRVTKVTVTELDAASPISSGPEKV